jgi:branched-chain amino acid transport system ATP-binding protein
VTALLELDQVDTYYGQIHILQGVNLVLHEGELVCLLGGNASGKSTTLKTILGIIEPRNGAVRLRGEDVTRRSTSYRIRQGIAIVPENRRLFAPMTVLENLQMGAYLRGGGTKEDFDRVYELFPLLYERRAQLAGTLSGGEQQMVAIGRALMSAPKLLMLDEPTLGLAPQICDEIFAIITRLCKQDGVSVLLVEQNAQMALSIADDGYIMENGRIVLDGPADKMLRNEDVREFYLGFGEGGSRKNMRDVKHYKRRKRWLS